MEWEFLLTNQNTALPGGGVMHVDHQRPCGCDGGRRRRRLGGWRVGHRGQVGCGSYYASRYTGSRHSYGGLLE